MKKNPCYAFAYNSCEWIALTALKVFGIFSLNVIILYQFYWAFLIFPFFHMNTFSLSHIFVYRMSTWQDIYFAFMFPFFCDEENKFWWAGTFSRFLHIMLIDWKILQQLMQCFYSIYLDTWHIITTSVSET